MGETTIILITALIGKKTVQHAEKRKGLLSQSSGVYTGRLINFDSKKEQSLRPLLPSVNYCEYLNILM